MFHTICVLLVPPHLRIPNFIRFSSLIFRHPIDHNVKFHSLKQSKNKFDFSNFQEVPFVLTVTVNTYKSLVEEESKL